MLYLKLLVLAFQLQPDSMHTTAHQANLHGRRPCRKHLLKTKHKQARLQFGNNHEDKPLSFWDPFLWSDETKVNLFGSDGVQNVWRRPREEYTKKCLVPTVKHGGGSLMVWGFISAHGVGELHFIDGIMNADMYCKLLNAKMIPSLKRLDRGTNFQHDNDPKHSAKMMPAF